MYTPESPTPGLDEDSQAWLARELESIRQQFESRIYTVAALPLGVGNPYPTGTDAYAVNARKAGETAGNGTGCPVWWYKLADIL